MLNGQIDELRISNVVRYSVAFTLPTAALGSDANTVGLFHFDEGSGQTSSDSIVTTRQLTFGTSSATETLDPTWAASTAPTLRSDVTQSNRPLQCKGQFVIATKQQNEGTKEQRNNETIEQRNNRTIEQVA
jgi:hypothetical protein